MGDDKVKESTAEVFATVAEVNTLFHSLEDMLVARFEAIDGKFGVVVEKFAAIENNLAEMDARNQGRFAAIEKSLIEMNAKYEERFEAIDFRFEVLVEKLNAMDAKNEGKFDLLEQKFVSQDFKIEHCVTSANNKLMIMLLVIAGSIIAGLLYGG